MILSAAVESLIDIMVSEFGFRRDAVSADRFGSKIMIGAECLRDERYYREGICVPEESALRKAIAVLKAQCDKSGMDVFA